MPGEWNPEPPRTWAQRLRRTALFAFVIPAAILLFLGVIGAVDGLADRDCQPGFFSACGWWERSLAWMVFVGFYLLIVYYSVLLLTYLIRGLARILRS